jgi:hypothetical protein
MEPLSERVCLRVALAESSWPASPRDAALSSVEPVSVGLSFLCRGGLFASVRVKAQRSGFVFGVVGARLIRNT